MCSAHNAFMCFAWIWEQTAIISLYIINLSVFKNRSRECLLPGTKWVFKLDRYSFVLKGLTRDLCLIMTWTFVYSPSCILVTDIIKMLWIVGFLWKANGMWFWLKFFLFTWISHQKNTYIYNVFYELMCYFVKRW